MTDPGVQPDWPLVLKVVPGQLQVHVFSQLDDPGHVADAPVTTARITKMFLKCIFNLAKKGGWE